MHHYMVELILRERWVWVIGGGTVATRKIRGLLDTGARLHVMAPEVSPDIIAWEGQGRLDVRKTEFQEGCLDRVDRPLLVFAATGSAPMNQEIARICRRLGVLCNSADDPGVSDFLVPAVVRRGALTVAVGTEGASPALSRLIKERIDRWLEPGWQGLVALFGQMRSEVAHRLPDPLTRQAFWRNIALQAEKEECHRLADPRQWFRRRLDQVAGTDNDTE
ncbi:MAG: bifunctional precorrin-2 dehydrogenase/sirohydrochlorin ferrochelatase [Magnetococcales bacterium]|nr:bifunctional precorrin-2 dehydrogenase/sirohydrochlorin ferrochelatase [Magnetococcales bacterium]